MQSTCCAHSTQGSYVGAICFLNSNGVCWSWTASRSQLMLCMWERLLWVREGARRECPSDASAPGSPVPKSHRDGTVVISQGDAVLGLSSNNRPPRPTAPLSEKQTGIPTACQP